MNRFLENIRDYFGFSRKETRGFLVLVGLMVTLWFSPLVYDRLFSDTSKTLPVSDVKTADSLAAILQSIQPEKKSYEKNYDRFERKNDYAENPDKPFVLTDFDPNTASTEQLQSLGIPRFIAERIEKYRSKGGKFRNKEDLQKIYDFSPELYDKLEPFIAISADNQPNRFEKTTFEKPAFTENKPVFTKPVISIFDINRADTTQLIGLRGIGSKLAARIIKFRDGLGGFHNTNQYNEVFGLDSLALDELRKYTQIKTAANQINLNTATIEELDRHPYISFKQAQLMVRFREQHGNYSSAQDLLKIKIFDEKFIEKIKPYLNF